MTVRKPESSVNDDTRKLRGDRRAVKRYRHKKRRSLLETLETRQLLTGGPTLVGIQADSGALLDLSNSQTLSASPRELTFRFDQSTTIDPTTLDAIKIIRAGGDGTFESAKAVSDFGSLGAVRIEFEAVTPGAAGNGLSVVFSKAFRTDSSLPAVTVTNNQVNIELNSNPQLVTRAQDIQFGINQNPTAANTLRVSQVVGQPFFAVGTSAADNFTLVLSGADRAQATSSLGAANAQVRFTAVGSNGADLAIDVRQAPLAFGATPIVSVVGSRIEVLINSTTGSRTTVGEFVGQLNGNPNVTQLMTAALEAGNPNSEIGSNLALFSPIEFSAGADSFDVVVEPGFRGLGDSEREVIFRFSEDLPQDIYRIEIDGASQTALRDTSGERFNMGANQTFLFNLNLAPTVQAVVPQPVVTQNGVRSQLRDQVWVYFDRNDPLDVALARNTSLYELTATRGTESSNDDLVLQPINVSYNPGTGVAVLQFANDLHVLSGGAGPEKYRLRVGETETRGSAPTVVPTVIEPGDSFASAKDLAGDWNVATSSISSVIVNGAIAKTENINGFDISNNEYLIDFLGSSDVPGHRDLRPEDPSRLDRPVPLDHLRSSADSIDGVTSIFYNFFGQYQGDDPTTRGLDNDKTYFNSITEQQKDRVREALDLYSQFLGVQFVETEALGIQIAVGDLIGANPDAVSGQGGLAFATNNRLPDADDVLNGDQYPSLVDLQLIQDADSILTGIRTQPLGVLDLQDFDESNDDLFGQDFFQGALLIVGQLLGFGIADELPDPTFNQGVLNPVDLDADPTFPGPADIIHGQYLYRPDSTDIDLYRFVVPTSGEITVESIAERLPNSSQLDTHLRLYRQSATGVIDELAANDDYWSEDSQIVLDLSAGTYFVGVSASGNDNYNAAIEDTGIGGLSEGSYDLHISFSPLATVNLTDSTGIALDGDSDGVAGGAFDFWFDAASANRTIFVDKDPGATSGLIGSLSNPYRTISTALSAAEQGVADIVRILPSDGADQDISTQTDNSPYLIGFSEFGTALSDGSSFQVPKDVTVMVDAGAIFKLRRARIGVGSSSPVIDHSGGSLQVLGTPILTGINGAQLTALPSSGEVVFTSLSDATVGGTQSPNLPRSGDWGGIDFRSDIDKLDENRTNLEREGIFTNIVQFGFFQYGGGVVLNEGRAEVISPIELSDTRATIAHTTILNSADAAIEATPNTFEESKFSGFDGQAAADYSRIGPDIHDVSMDGNSLNGLFVRSETRDGSGLQPVTVQARFDDLDVVHVLTENLEIQGTPGGGLVETAGPPTLLVRLTAQQGGNLAPGDYAYKLTFVDANQNESPSSNSTIVESVSVGQGSILLEQLPSVPSGGDFVARRLYRAPVSIDPITGNAVPGEFRLIQAINGSSEQFLDIGFPEGPVLNTPEGKIRARLDARLAIDSGVVIKSSGAAIELGIGTQLIAEGDERNEIIFTSLDDRRYGRSGNFNTNEAPEGQGFQPGDWGGIYVGAGATASLDHIRLVGAGGGVRIEGELAGFNPIEVHQGDLRLTNSRIEESGTGLSSVGGQRGGRGSHDDGVVFSRGAQPVIANNTFINNESTAITIDVNSLSNNYVNDTGRTTGRLDSIGGLGNQGPLISGNVLSNNGINGLEIRGGELATGGVWDDTDIVHVVRDTITIPNQHVFGGLRLESSAVESLIVKFQSTDTSSATIIAGGDETSAIDQFGDIGNRIGGAFQIIGQPGHPVVLTSLNDDSVGAGFDPQGRPQTDTNNSRQLDFGSTAVFPVGPEVPNGTIIDNDVDVATPGFFSFGPVAGGGVGVTAGGGTNEVTTQGVTTLFQQQNALFDYLNFIDVGADGAAIELGTTNITTQPTLIADDIVVSEGNFAGSNGTINWAVEQSFQDGSPTLVTQLTLSSTAPIGDLRFINYYDPVIATDSGDLLFAEGTPGTNDYRVTVLDGPERVGFRHYGVLEQGPGLDGARYEGWVGDAFPDLITAPNFNLPFDLNGTVDQTSIPLAAVPDLPAPVYGPAITTTAHAWLVNPAATTVTITAVLELIESEFDQTVGGGTPGDWEGLVIREAAHDRNFDITVENEGDLALNRNDSPSVAQFIGEIAPTEKAASENRRLGFQVLGTIQDPSDIDVYSFEAEGGTEVWLDIDRTNTSLDSVVELLDSEGNILALSDGSVAEEIQPGLLVQDSVIGSTKLSPLSNSSLFNTNSTSAFGVPQDLFSTNPRDPGMRVVLPGELGEVFTYQVRVRSSNVGPGQQATRLQNPDLIFDGLTAGAYELSLRLNETDETPGSFFNLADIRYANTGITVIGQPLHSPLLGEEAETTGNNDTRTNSQPLGPFATGFDGSAGLLTADFLIGDAIISSDSPLSVGSEYRIGVEIFQVVADNGGGQYGVVRPLQNTVEADHLIGDNIVPIGPSILTSDSGSKSISGNLDSFGDVDWYQFSVDYQNITRDGLGYFLSTTFDIDYADGLARPDLSIWVYDSSGQLILAGLDSNIADDQPGQTGSTDTSDLSRGSSGTFDPYIGAAELPEGTYFVAISGRDNIPAALNQFNDAATVNPLIRLEPIESVERIVEDHVSSSFFSTATPPQLNVLFDPVAAPTPYTLSDIPIYVSTGGTVQNIQLVNPFTGDNYGTIGSTNGPAFGDIAIRPNGDVQGFNINGVVNDTTWRYYNIDSGNAAVTDLTPAGTGLNTDPAATVSGVIFNAQGQPAVATVAIGGTANSGVIVNAITFDDVNNAERGFLVGNRGAHPFVDLAYTDNILWEFTPATGQVEGAGGVGALAPIFDAGQTAIIGATADHAFASPQERGHIETGPLIPNQRPDRIGVTAATIIDTNGNLVPSIVDELEFTVQDFVGPNSVTFQLDLGSAIQIVNSVPTGTFIRDGEVLNVAGQEYEFDTGARLQLTGSADISLGGVRDGSRVTLQDRDGVSLTFEFDDGLGVLVNQNAIPVSLLGATTDAGAAQALAAAINAAPDFDIRAAAANTGEVVLSFDSNSLPVIGGFGIASVGEIGASNANAIAIRVEEVTASSEVAAAVASTLVSTGVPVSQSGARIGFLNDPTVTFTQFDALNTAAITVVGTPGVSSGAAREIDFDVRDSAAEIAQRIVAAINAAEASGLLSNVNAFVSGNSVQLVSAEVNAGTIDAPLTAGGVAPGGTVTGISIVNDTMFAVSSAGGLYQISNANFAARNSVGTEIASYVSSATDLLGINFSGLASGPENVENGRYANLLFGIDSAGELYAFNTSGELQPVFAGNRSSISTGVAGATGIDFSNLDSNLWHITDVDAINQLPTPINLPGHGVNSTFNGTRGNVLGDAAWYFGFDADSPLPAGTVPPTAPRAVRGPVEGTYDFAGGAHGELISNEFSLEGFSPSDLPTFYYNYFLETDDAIDRIRLYVIDSNGIEHSLSTNNQHTGTDTSFADDEFDDATDFFTGQFYDDGIVAETQELFDNTGTWRQARVPLDDFAGMDGLRLRFEFSTSGSLEFGESRIRAISGVEIRDGDSFTIEGRDFEFVLDPVLTIPPGNGIVDGDIVSIDDVNYQFATNASSVPAPNVAVPFATTDSAEEIATTLRNTIADLQIAGTQQLDLDNSDASQLNDTIATATLVELPGPNALVTSTGSIGTPDGSLASVDVDMLELRLTAGQNLLITISETTSAPLLNPIARLFDVQGTEIFRGQTNINGETVVPFTAPEDGVFFLGIGGEGNDSYDPFSNTVGRVFGRSGAYDISIQGTRAYDIRAVGDRVILNGTGNVGLSQGTTIRLEGGDGSIGIPIPINRDMTAEDVAQAVADAIRTSIGGGRIETVAVRGETLQLPGLTVNNFGPLGQSLRSGDLFADPSFTITDPGMAFDNEFRGVYLDDFIVGFRERGEFVTGTNVDDTFALDSGLDRTNPALPAQAIQSGPYQLEIRSASEHVVSRTNSLFTSFDTNDRLTQAVSIETVSADLIRDELDRQRSIDPAARLTFSLNDGQTTVVFEFVDSSLSRPAADGNVPVVYNSGIIDPISGRSSFDSAATVAASLVQAINLPEVQALLNINALSSSGVSPSEAEIRGDNRINLSGNVNIEATSIQDILNTVIFNHRGDRNVDRDLQGVIRIDGVRISDSAGFGIELDHGQLRGETFDDTGASNNDGTPNIVRYPRNLVEQNTANLAPGVLVQNNLLANNRVGGINIVGLGVQPNGRSLVPFDRIVNNTIVGGSINKFLVDDPLTVDNTIFQQGALSFADQVVNYSPSVANPPAGPLQNSGNAIGAPDYVPTVEPQATGGEGVVSLGVGGSITLQFVDNRLVGNGDSSPDLQIFEVGNAERVRVEVSIDGVIFTDIGTVVGGNNKIDIDAAGFGPTDQISFVRLTDQGFVIPGDIAVGADIDAVGAISSVAADQFTAGGIGINLQNGVSPTLLNNVIVNSDVAVQADTSSTSAVLAGNTYQLNAADVNGLPSVGELARVRGPLDNLFIDPSGSIFIPTKSSDLIDSSIDSLEDRPELLIIKEPVGLLESPILAPDLDANGAQRIDDPTHEVPGGQGELVFKDRGAFDRGDQASPRGLVISPLDNARDNSDFDPRIDAVQVLTTNNAFFEILLVDGGEPANPRGGVGINDSTVTGDAVLVFENNVALVEGRDYVFGYDSSGDVIRITPLAGLWKEDAVYQIRLLNGSQNVLTVSPAVDYNDGDRISIIDGLGVQSDFEIERGIIISLPALAGDFADAIDGQTFVIFDGQTERRFEYESQGGVLQNNFPVQFPVDPTTNFPVAPTVNQLSAAIANAITASGLNLQAIDLGGSVQILSPNNLTLVTPETATLTTNGAIGVTSGFGIQVPNLGGVPQGVVDGQEFTIRRADGRQRTFELDFDGSVINTSALPVRVGFNPSLDDIAQAIALAVAQGALDLNPQVGQGGQVLFPDAADVTLDLQASVFTQIGTPGGQAANEIVLAGNLTTEQVQRQIIQAIETANLNNVTVSVTGGRVIVQGSSSLTGVGALRVLPISDNAGNVLTSNDELTGTTQFTIFLAAGSDFGDAPAPYASSLENNGPRHEVVAGFSLGSTATPETDARTPNGDSDDGVAFTSLVTAAFGTNLSVDLNNTAGINAVIDGWVDWDQDGVFEANERVLDGQALVNGTNNLSILVPSSALGGETYGRFRLTSTGINSPLGAALDGEVEDITLTVQTSPYQNPTNRYDVNDSGDVSPIDVLQILNQITRSGSNAVVLPFPAPVDAVPPYLDVNGDGIVTANDALVVLNYLNSLIGGAEAEATQWTPVENGLLETRPYSREEAPPVLEATDNSSLSIFDEPASIELEEAIGDIAEDQSDDTETSAIDDFFAKLTF